MDRKVLYNVIYALAALNGREAALFGDCASLAREAFRRSLAGDYFPELWFELPLAGEPWLDLHALAAVEDLNPDATFDPDTCGGVPEVFRWFANQGSRVRQLALSWDVSSGDIELPAVQLLRRTSDTQTACDFLEVAGAHEAAFAYRLFEERLPQDWFACYSGVFPERKEPFLRVECIPAYERQQAYANDAGLLAEDFLIVGYDAIDDVTLSRCQTLAVAPFQLEFQFDVTPEGKAGATLGVSDRFAAPAGQSDYKSFDVDGEAGELMRQVVEWGLADERWRLLADTAFAQRLKLGQESCMLYCYPAFLKLRWRNGLPLDAKAYLITGVQ